MLRRRRWYMSGKPIPPMLPLQRGMMRSTRAIASSTICSHPGSMRATLVLRTWNARQYFRFVYDWLAEDSYERCVQGVSDVSDRNDLRRADSLNLAGACGAAAAAPYL